MSTGRLPPQTAAQVLQQNKLTAEEIISAQPMQYQEANTAMRVKSGGKPPDEPPDGGSTTTTAQYFNYGSDKAKQPKTDKELLPSRSPPKSPGAWNMRGGLSAMPCMGVEPHPDSVFDDHANAAAEAVAWGDKFIPRTRAEINAAEHLSMQQATAQPYTHAGYNIPAQHYTPQQSQLTSQMPYIKYANAQLAQIQQCHFTGTKITHPGKKESL